MVCVCEVGREKKKTQLLPFAACPPSLSSFLTRKHTPHLLQLPAMQTSQLLSFGLAKAEERAKEREELVAALKDGIKDVSSDGADLVHKFITKKQEV